MTDKRRKLEVWLNIIGAGRFKEQILAIFDELEREIQKNDARLSDIESVLDENDQLKQRIAELEKQITSMDVQRRDLVAHVNELEERIKWFEDIAYKNHKGEHFWVDGFCIVDNCFWKKV